jgi:hypothetical protein
LAVSPARVEEPALPAAGGTAGCTWGAGLASAEVVLVSAGFADSVAESDEMVQHDNLRLKIDDLDVSKSRVSQASACWASCSEPLYN